MAVSTKAAAESMVTRNAENQSHHSLRPSCRRLNSASCARNATDPSRGETWVLRARRPNIDSITFLCEGHLHLRLSTGNRATRKWFRFYHHNLLQRPGNGGSKRVSHIGDCIRYGRECEAAFRRAVEADACRHDQRQGESGEK